MKWRSALPTAARSQIDPPKKRRRVKQTTSLQTRLGREADRLKSMADTAATGHERNGLLAKARQMEEASEIVDVLRPARSSEGRTAG
jgi:hypothetical protein